jgi:hypothetical protein
MKAKLEDEVLCEYESVGNMNMLEMMKRNVEL